LIPFKVQGGKPQPPSPPANHVYAVPEKAEYEIEFPVVESYQDPGIVRVKVNWDRVGELLLDPEQVPDDVLLRGLASPDGRLIAYGPGAPVRVSLEAWRRGVRVQQVAFDLAKVLVRKWREDRGDAIPVHRLFPQMLDAANHFIDEHVTPINSRAKQDLAINPYFGKAIAMMVNAMETVDDGGASQEKPVFCARCGRGAVNANGELPYRQGATRRAALPPQCCGVRFRMGAGGGRPVGFTSGGGRLG
jgi:type III restriction enzyme